MPRITEMSHLPVDMELELNWRTPDGLMKSSPEMIHPFKITASGIDLLVARSEFAIGNMSCKMFFVHGKILEYMREVEGKSPTTRYQTITRREWRELEPEIKRLYPGYTIYKRALGVPPQSGRHPRDVERELDDDT